MKKIIFWLKKNPKFIAVTILLFWVLFISINIPYLLNFSNYVRDEGSTFESTREPESDLGMNILTKYKSENSSFQLLIYDPEENLITEEKFAKIRELINTILLNDKIGPFLSPEKPYASFIDDADNLLKSILGMQWFATQSALAGAHIVGGGLEHFSEYWVTRYNETVDVSNATNYAYSETLTIMTDYLIGKNESRYIELNKGFLEELSINMLHYSSIVVPNTAEDCYDLLLDVLSENITLFSKIQNQSLLLDALLYLSSNFNHSLWTDENYNFQEITRMLFDKDDDESVNFVKEVYANATLEGYIIAKNKYLLPLLKKELTIPPINDEIIDTFLKQYTNYRNENSTISATIVIFNIAVSYRGENGQALYNELIRILPALREVFSNFELYITGVDLLVIELTNDFEEQIARMDKIIILTIIIILILVYRSPILPLVQLTTIGIAFAVSRIFFVYVNNNIHGLINTSLIVMSVSMLGATTDYSVYLIGDYSYHLKNGCTKMEALRKTLIRTPKSIIVASASLTIGFSALALSQFFQLRSMGIAGALGFITAMIVSITVVPSILLLLKSKWITSWQLQIKKGDRIHEKMMTFVRKNIKKPIKPLIVGLILSIIGISFFFSAPTDFAQLSTAPDYYASKEGFDKINEYLGSEYTSQIILLFELPKEESFIYSNGSLNYAYINSVKTIIDEVLMVTKIEMVLGISHPLGQTYQESLNNTSLFIAEEIQVLMKNYILPDTNYAFVYLGSQYPEGDLALDQQVLDIRNIVKEKKNELGIQEWNIYLTGIVGIITDFKVSVQNEFFFIFLVTLTAIWLLLLIYLKNIAVSLRSLATIFVSFSISLGIFTFITTIILQQSIYWIVPLILFIILLSIGLDSDALFLGIFIHEYRKDKNPNKAIIEGISETSKNISIAGIIMAVTYLTLILTSSKYMQQLGLGIAIGILIDVFFTRYYIVPPAMVLSTLKRKNLIDRNKNTDTQKESKEDE